MRGRLLSYLVAVAFLCGCARGEGVSGGWHDVGPVEYILPRHRSPFYESPYFSRHKTESLPHTNLALPGALDAVFAKRSFKGEIIISCFRHDDYSLRWAHHFMKMTQDLGFDHALAIGYNEESCDTLRRTWCGGVRCNDTSLYPGCAWLDPRVDGGDPRWRDALHVDQIVYLWMVRYYVAAEALRRGINVLMSDTDVVIVSDFYQTVKARPLADFNMFIMTVTPCPNGGMWYIQNAHPRGPLSHMLSNAVHRMLAIAGLWRNEPPGWSINLTSIRNLCSWEDQGALSDGLVRAATWKNASQWLCLDAPVDDGRWRTLYGDALPAPKPAGDKPMTGWPPLPLFDPPWGKDELYVRGGALERPNDYLGICAGAGEGEGGDGKGNGDRGAECRRLQSFVDSQGPASHVMTVRSFADIPQRPDGAGAAGAAGAGGAGEGPEGPTWWSAEGPWNPNMSTAGPWAPADLTEEVIRGPRYLMGDWQALWYGWTQAPPKRSWSVLVHLVSFGRSWGAGEGNRNSREHLIQVRGLWHGPVRAPMHMMRLSPALVAQALAVDHGEGDATLREVLKALMVLAAVTRRAPVLPAVACEALPWIGRSDVSRLDVEDGHWISYAREDGRVMCTPQLSSGHLCSSGRVLSEFHLDPERNLLAGSYSEGTVTVPASASSRRRGRSALEAEEAAGDAKEWDSAGLVGPRARARRRRGFLETSGGGAEELVASALSTLRHEDLRAHNGTRVLALETGDLGALLRVVREPAALAAALSEKEKKFLDTFFVDCWDYTPAGLTRTQLGYNP